MRSLMLVSVLAAGCLGDPGGETFYDFVADKGYEGGFTGTMTAETSAETTVSLSAGDTPNALDIDLVLKKPMDLYLGFFCGTNPAPADTYGLKATLDPADPSKAKGQPLVFQVDSVLGKKNVTITFDATLDDDKLTVDATFSVSGCSADTATGSFKRD